MKLLLNLLLLAPLAVSAQDVAFKNDLNWQQIKELARAKNKYIFVDCYASWCGPCKMMDRDVYPNDSVRQLLNSQFVSVKVQMDTSKNDNDTVKAWYTDAHSLMSTYEIRSYPSFLFFAPDGHIVHRWHGYLPAPVFIKLAMNAMDPSKQYYTLLDKYRSGNLEINALPYLANCATSSDENAVAMSVVTDYLHNFLDKSSDVEICTMKNLKLLAQFSMVLSSKDKVFETLCHHGELADSAMQMKGFAKRFVNAVIIQEEIKPVTDVAKATGKEPDWDRISIIIKNKFGDALAQDNIIQAKIGWYFDRKDWENLTKYLVKQVDLRISQNDLDHNDLNEHAWWVFKWSDNKKELEQAVTWSDRAIELEEKPIGNELDTKANLLYKLGKKKEALALEAKAVELDPRNKGISEAYKKMQLGEPTAWVIGLR